jgi:uncharacterized membrane protein
MEQQNLLPTQTEKQPFNFMDFLQFKRMITLQVIPIFYTIVAVIITIGALGMMFAGGSSRGYGGYGGYGGGGGGMFSLFSGGGFFAGLIFLIVGNVFWRMWCEFILVLFRINKNTAEMEKNTRK